MARGRAFANGGSAGTTALLGRIDFRGLGPDPIAEARTFAGVQDVGELNRRFAKEVAQEVTVMLALVEAMDAFDVIELMRLRELPLVPVLGLEQDFDGNAAVVELVGLMLLSRGSRAPSVAPGPDVQHPHTVVPELHDRSSRLLRLSLYRHLHASSLRRDDPLARLSGEYQAHLTQVRSMRYQSIEDKHDGKCFDRQDVDELVEAKLGFTYRDFVLVRDAIQGRYSDDFTALRDRTAELVDSVGDPKLASETEAADFREAIVAMMFLPGARASFDTAAIAARSLVGIERVQRIVDAFSTEFDGSWNPEAVVSDFLRGVNPLERGSLVRDSDGNYISTGRAIGADSLRMVIESGLKTDRRTWKRYDRARKDATEGLALEALRTVLGVDPTAANLKYMAPRRGVTTHALGRDCEDVNLVADQTEGDGLFVVGDVAICVEVKGRAIAEAARRGDHVRLRREIETIIGDGHRQAARLTGLIETNQGVWLEAGEWLDLSHIREVRSILATLDSLGPLSVSLGDLMRAGVASHRGLPWIVSLHDLDIVTQILQRPSELLLYLRRRTDSGVAEHYRGVDELDMFALFLDGGLYVEPDPDEVHRRYPSTPPVKKHEVQHHRSTARPTRVGTFTDALDAWMYWVEGTNPDETSKPTFAADPDLLSLVDFLADGCKPGWFRFGADLLGLSGEAQRNLVSSLAHIVRKTRKDHVPHSVSLGYAGMWGYPTFFAATVPANWPRSEQAAKLHTYMEAKRFQLGSDRALGVLLDEQRHIVHIKYANRELESDEGWDVVGDAIGLAPVGEDYRPIPPSANRGSRRLRGRKRSRRS